MEKENVPKEDRSLQYNITMRKIHRGVIVIIGCEQFMFHMGELNFMASVLSDYVEDYTVFREYCETGSGLESYVGVVFNGSSCFQYYDELHIRPGRIGYELVLETKGGEEEKMYFSTTGELSKVLSKVILDYELKVNTTKPENGNLTTIRAMRWDPVGGKIS